MCIGLSPSWDRIGGLGFEDNGGSAGTCGSVDEGRMKMHIVLMLRGLTVVVMIGLMLLMVFIGVGGRGDTGDNDNGGGDGVHADKQIFRVF